MTAAPARRSATRGRGRFWPWSTRAALVCVPVVLAIVLLLAGASRTLTPR